MGSLCVVKGGCHMKRKLPTVTIALSALNEEKNIQAFLQSVLSQKEDGFILENILVYSDGSTDDTVAKVKAFKNSKIIIKDGKNRIGKSSRLNEIYAIVQSDYLVQSDADVVFSHPYVVKDMIQPLIKEKEVGMCGGHPSPIPGETFVEKAINCTFEAYAPLRKMLRGGNNVFSVDGRILSYKKALYKKFVIPSDTIANDAYTFFFCITHGYQYRYVPTGIVLFRSPQTLKDQIKQNTRFTAAPIRMERLFAENVVKPEYFIPKHLLLWLMLKQFIKHPILCSYIFIVNLYCKLRSKKAEKVLTAKWPMAYSTKDFQSNDK